MADLAQRLRLLARTLLRDWRTTAFAILAFALGIGLTTASFSIVRGTFFRGLPFAGGSRLVRVESIDTNGRKVPVTIRDFTDWSKIQTTFTGLAAWLGVSLNTSGHGELPMRYNGAFVSANFFKVVAVPPALGRGFLPSEGLPGAPRAAVISASVWRHRFGAASDVVGQSIRVYGQPTTIVGVMPRGFRFPLNQNLWVPFRIDPPRVARGKGWPLQVVGRLKAGVTLKKAEADLSGICDQLAREYPDTNRGKGVVLTPFVQGYTNGGERRAYLLVFGLAVALLLIATANVSNLLLVRGLLRSKETALRIALGGMRARVISEVLAESALLALGGCVIGLGLAWLGVHCYAQAIQYRPGPFWQAVKLDAPSYAFAALITIASGLLSGLLPALRSTGEDPGEILREASGGTTGRRTGHLGRRLVVSQVALSFALVLATALMGTSLLRIRERNLGFDPAGILSFHLSLYGDQYPDGRSQIHAFDELRSRISALPSVRDAALSSSIPGDFTRWGHLEIEGKTYGSEGERPVTRWSVVTPSFFSVLPCQLLRGRILQESDRLGNLPVAVVSRSLAKSFFPGGEAVGRRIGVDMGDGRTHWVRIVGVISDILMGTSEENDYRVVFLPFAQYPQPGMNFLLRTRLKPERAIPAVRGAVARFNRDLPIWEVKPLQQVLAEDVRSYEIAGGLVSIFGIIALVLAALGVYALLAIYVRGHEREVGIQMALGAGPIALAREMIIEVWAMVGVGLAIGAALSFAFSRGLRVLLFGVSPYDPITYLIAALILLGAATVASLPPIYRAIRVDPMEVLREE